MSAYVLTNATIVLGSPTVGAIDISQYTGSLDTSPGTVTVRDIPNFAGGGYMTRIAGLKGSAFKVTGYSDFAAAAFNAAFLTPAATLGQQIAAGVALPQSGSAVAAGDPMHFTRGIINTFSPFSGSIDNVAAYELGLVTDTAPVTGQAATSLAARTTTANGTALTLTGPTAAQRVWAGLWVTAASGSSPTLAVKIQSAPASNFASPTDRITFTTVGVTGWQFASLAGAVTDGFWRAIWTIGGGSPSFTFIAAVGVI